MKIGLVFLDKFEAAPPLSLAYIASYLRKYGEFNDIIIIDKEDPVKAVKREKPDIVGITSVTKDFKKATETAEEIKSCFDIKTILGGVHITQLPRTLPKCFDLGVLGEGEETMLELMRIYEKYGEFKKDSLKKVKGVVFNENGRFHITERRPFIEPLDKIPYPARDLLNMDFYLKPSRMVPDKISIGTTMMTSRGCPYSCVYCASPQFWRKKTRFHSAKYVFGEMKFLEEKYKVKTIRIWDDLFTVNTKRLRELVDLIRSDGLHEKIEFYCYGRANLMTEDICKLIKKMNVKYISFGFESNSERVLNYLKRGTVTVKQNENALKLCKKYGFVTDGTFIFGTPGETKEDMEKTFDLIKNENLDRALAFTLTPFPGTEIWEYAKSIGVLKNENEIDWQKIDLRKFSENIYMNKAMTKQEFLKEFDTIQKYISEVKNTSIPQIELKYLFNPHFIRRFLSNWRGFSNEFINGVKIKLSHTKK